jgi:Uma2 family endonuclease
LVVGPDAEGPLGDTIMDAMSEVVTRIAERLITGDELVRMPDPGPCELIDGRIVPMTPTGGEHAWIEANVAVVLREFTSPRGLGKVLVGEVGIFTRRNPDRVRGADVLFISNERYARWSNKAGFLDVAPDLVVEILSPNDAAMDFTEKLREYFAIGVRLVWVLDPRVRGVYAHRGVTDVRLFQGTDQLPGDDVLPGFEVPVATLFEA